jgi:hypothetical protein
MNASAERTMVCVLRLERQDGIARIYLSINSDINDPAAVRRLITADLERAFETIRETAQWMLEPPPDGRRNGTVSYGGPG